MLGAALCWAIGTVLVKKFAWDGLEITALTGWQQLIGGLPIVIGWWLLEPVPDLRALSLPAALGLAYAVLIATIFCQTAFFKLLSLLPAHVAGHQRAAGAGSRRGQLRDDFGRARRPCRDRGPDPGGRRAVPADPTRRPLRGACLHLGLATRTSLAFSLIM